MNSYNQQNKDAISTKGEKVSFCYHKSGDSSVQKNFNGSNTFRTTKYVRHRGSASSLARTTPVSNIFRVTHCAMS